MHISIGNFKYMEKLRNPHVVGSYLKYVLKSMAEPLVTFQVYEQIKEMAKPGGQTVLIEFIISEFKKLPTLNLRTLESLIYFLTMAL